jgi:hypothetical protein
VGSSLAIREAIWKTRTDKIPRMLTPPKTFNVSLYKNQNQKSKIEKVTEIGENKLRAV